ncbi:class I SAM-dependent methyltransferase [Mucilaginibacter paludis]|uniref:Methyltransferase type 11 n=1 Tax=Mucilaginibacter paludis DSM 18603 TaxID=714943 RepID=H1YGA6_9SPHI|nr:class I SAM-dependent methyltransferase [Mucilaginibacter paludis]EHQ27370.1 Methyltransferase type 11 [Mucilaginibacter paludis DSM 18603]
MGRIADISYNQYAAAMLQTIRNLIRYKALHIPDREPREAYNLWADNYDDQPDNLMFHLDHMVFGQLMEQVPVKGRVIADIGCGTGRHWPRLFQNQPASLTGYDVSEGMLKRLKLKFPDANTVQIKDNFLNAIPDHTYHLIISTLTVAHIENIEEALLEWCRVLKPGGDMIITDFHPTALAAGGKRTFQYQNRHIPIQNFVHSTGLIKAFFERQGLLVVQDIEKIIDNSVMHYYIKQDAMHVYQKFRGTPMIYGLHLKKV